jgi:hypothetical protein
MENTLVRLYRLACQLYDSHSSLKYQRDSNFKPVFTDEKLITVYLFGHFNEKFNHRQIHGFIILASVWLYQICFLKNYKENKPLVDVKEQIEKAQWRIKF